MLKIYVFVNVIIKKEKKIYVYVVKSMLILNMAFNNCNAFVSAFFDIEFHECLLL